MKNIYKHVILITFYTLMVSGCNLLDFISSDDAVSSSPSSPISNDPASPQPDEGETPLVGIRGNIYIKESQLLVMESYPVQVVLNIKGDLPTPCHQFQASVSLPNPQNQIRVDVYTVADPDTVCIQILQSFEEAVPIPMSGQADGLYSVWVNGEKVAEFSYPS